VKWPRATHDNNQHEEDTTSVLPCTWMTVSSRHCDEDLYIVATQKWLKRGNRLHGSRRGMREYMSHDLASDCGIAEWAKRLLSGDGLDLVSVVPLDKEKERRVHRRPI
jgi:hypothetical protein